MSVIAFEGPAGSGKTHRLMEELGALLGDRPLAGHERVLAVTFMQGSRRRLDDRLREVKGLSGRFEAMTLDSFAWRLTQRWRLLARHLNFAMPAEDDYNATCALAAALLQKSQVRAWVTLSYPYIVVDEAQDLSSERSAMIAALAHSGTILLAYDEFQCLNPELLPIAIESWLHDHCEPTLLQGCCRTDDVELIEAARAVREGRVVRLEGRGFQVIATPGRPEFAATWIANAITWRRGGNVAMLTPSRKGGFAERIVARIGAGPVGKRQNGPYAIRWEGNDAQESAALWDGLGIVDDCTVADALQTMALHRSVPVIKRLYDWLLRRRGTSGMEMVTAAALRLQLNRAVSERRRHGGRSKTEFAAMTIQQAKNREFDHVIILWPYTAPKDDEQRRRLLYNAITRAKRSCMVLAQSADLLRVPPFVP